ncbi:hypothetical protein OIU76_024736 [Salix suchowensis]|nr:hypothetical protein OIU76_024736 [Salix suchowensis]
MSNFNFCYRIVPCLADPARRSSLGLKAALVALHLVYAGILFLFDSDLIEKTKEEPWYTAIYLLLFVVALIQYFVTSSSSPGYVLDAMRDVNEKNSLYRRSSMLSKQPASSKSGSFFWTCTPLEHLLELSHVHIVMLSSLHEQSIAMIVTNVFSSLTIIVFGLGRALARGNHCQFWWYIFEETALCLWTGILYITYLKANILRVWWKDAVMILLLVTLSIALIFLLLLLIFHSYLILTYQTTYELVRRRRIPYLRGIPERVFPFSKGVCRNLYDFCFGRSSIYSLERLPTAMEIEEKSRPYTCSDFLTCRCC